MPNTSLRVGCGNKIVYISQNGPRNLQDGRKIKAGLGVADECCSCECTDCPTFCSGSSFADNFSAADSPRVPPYHGVVGNWEWENPGLRLVPAGYGEFYLAPLTDDPLYEVVLSAEGYLDEDDDSVGEFKGGLKFNFLAGGDAVSGEFRVEYVSGNYACTLFLSAASGGGLAKTIIWTPHTFRLDLRISFLPDDTGSDDLEICAKLNGQIVWPAEPFPVNAPIQEFTEVNGGIFAEVIDDVEHTFHFESFTLCPYGACLPEEDWWTDNFDRYSKYTHVVGDYNVLTFPWEGTTGFVRNSAALQFEHRVQGESTVYVPDINAAEGLPSICTRIEAEYSLNPSYLAGESFFFGIIHSYGVQNTNIWARILKNDLGWVVNLGGLLISNGVSIPFTPTGNIKIELQTLHYGDTIYATVLIDDEPVWEQYELEGSFAVGTAAGISSKVDSVTDLQINYFTTSIVPKTYYDPITWDGSCTDLARTDNFSGSGDVGAPYTIVLPGDWVMTGGQARFAPVVTPTFDDFESGSLSLVESGENLDMRAATRVTVPNVNSQNFTHGLYLNNGTSVASIYVRTNPVGETVEILMSTTDGGFSVEFDAADGLTFDLAVCLYSHVPGFIQALFFLNGESYYSSLVEEVEEPTIREHWLQSTMWEAQYDIFSYFDYFCNEYGGPGQVETPPVQPAAQLGPPAAAISSNQPGTAARQIFSQYGCDGRSYIHTMNNNGLQWCKENLELIADWVIRSAKLKGKSADKNKTIQELEFVFSTLENQKNLS